MMSRPLESDADDRHAVAAEALIAEAFERFPIDRIGISFSGAEDVVLIDIAHRIRADLHVFSLDTGRLHPETYRFIERVREHYGVTIEMVSPDPDDVADLVRRKVAERPFFLTGA